jgi:hypothetical protein
VSTIVVFDLDGVLCRYRIERRLARLASWRGHSPEAIHAAIWRSGFKDEAKHGVMSADDDLRGFGARLGSPPCDRDAAPPARHPCGPPPNTTAPPGSVWSRPCVSHGPPPSPSCLPALEESGPQIKALGDVGISVRLSTCY